MTVYARENYAPALGVDVATLRRLLRGSIQPMGKREVPL